MTSPSWLTEARRLRKEGLPFAKIAKAVGQPYTNVWNALTIPAKPRTKIDPEKAAAASAAGAAAGAAYKASVRMGRTSMGCACELHLRDLMREYPDGAPTYRIPPEGLGVRYSTPVTISYAGSQAALCAEGSQ